MPVDRIDFKRFASSLTQRALLLYLIIYVVNVPLGPLVVKAASLLGLQLVQPMFVSRADTAYNYGLVVLQSCLAIVLALWWVVVERRPARVESYRQATRVLVRYWLAWTLVVYGAMKILPLQFPELGLDRLLQPIGQTSPMGLMWSFMSASPTYSAFSGVLELLAGLLLFSRRTTLMGAVLSAGLFAHISALNFSYDLPLKLFTAHLLLASLWLIAADAKRLLLVFTGSASGPSSEPALSLPGPWWRRLRVLLKGLVISAILGTTAIAIYEFQEMMEDFHGNPLLQGCWTLEPSSSAPDGEAWQRVIFPKLSLMATQDNWGRMTRYTAQFPAAPRDSGIFRLSDWQKPGWTATVHFQIKGDKLYLQGTWGGSPLHATLKRDPVPPFLLQTRGFHLVNERPFNQ